MKKFFTILSIISLCINVFLENTRFGIPAYLGSIVGLTFGLIASSVILSLIITFISDLIKKKTKEDFKVIFWSVSSYSLLLLLIFYLVGHFSN